MIRKVLACSNRLARVQDLGAGWTGTLNMQFHLDGFKPGDPEIAEPAAAQILPDAAVPEMVDVLIVGSGPAGLTLAAAASSVPETADVTTPAENEPMIVDPPSANPVPIDVPSAPPIEPPMAPPRFSGATILLAR